jgi:hypothetical protein
MNDLVVPYLRSGTGTTPTDGGCVIGTVVPVLDYARPCAR